MGGLHLPCSNMYLSSLISLTPKTNLINYSVSYMSSRLDYCNSLLCGIAGNLLQKLQSAQNAAGWLIITTRRIEHITPVLRQLHWLPVRQHIDFKLASSGVRHYTSSFHSTWLKTVSSWPTLAADHCNWFTTWCVWQEEHERVSQTGVFPSLDHVSRTLCLLHYVKETSLLYT